MKLKKCTQKQLKSLSRNNNIICFGYTKWLEEICRDETVREKIIGLVDNNTHIWGQTVKLGKSEVLVNDPVCIKSMLQEHVVVVITASYQELLYI